MITTAAGYRFTITPFSPLMTDITGEIIPVTDGTASEGVPRMENIAYLTEMAREIGYWARPAAYAASRPNWVLSYNHEDRRLEKTMLGEIARTARDEFAAGGLLFPQEYCGVIPPNWAASETYPIVREGAGAIDALVSSMGLARCSTGVIGDVPDTLTLRRAFYDFGQMRRFLLCFLNPYTSTPLRWADYVAAMKNGDKLVNYHMTGPMVVNDGDTSVTELDSTSTVDGYVPPTFEQEWNSAGSVTYTKSTSSSLCSVVNIYYYRTGLTTGTTWLPSTMQGWANFTGEARLSTGSIILLSAVFPTTFSFTSTVGRTSPFYGLGQAFYSTGIGTQMPQLFNLLNSWCVSNIPLWSSKRSYLSISLKSLHADSGILTLPSEIASSGWNWTP